MILEGVKLTIQPFGVGYANRPKKAQNGGVCGAFPHLRLPCLDLTTSARCFFFLQYKVLYEATCHSQMCLRFVSDRMTCQLYDRSNP